MTSTHLGKVTVPTPGLPVCVLLALLFTASLAPSATLISHTGGTDPNTFTTDGTGLHGSPVDSTGGAVAIAVATYNVTRPSISDSQGNSWTLTKDETGGGGGMSQAQFCAVLSSTSASHSFTLTSSGATYAGLQVQIWSGLTCTVDNSDMGNGTGGASYTVNTMTTGVSGDVIVQGTAFYTSTVAPTTTLINESYNVSDSEVFVSGSSFGSFAAYLVQSSAGNTNPTWAFTGATPVSNVYTQVAYEPSAGPPPRIRHRVISQ